MKNHLCQSCGMPLHNLSMCGTDSDGIRIKEYCIHCYKDGGFTSDITMEEMMRLCANYVEGNTRFYIASMKTLYPHLKRWAKKEDTESEYYKSINKVLEYVKSHMSENSDLKTLAGIACISPYHFHRIFKSVIGESLADYVNRLRMEYVAEQLKFSGLSLAQLAELTGYSSEQALSRAFKRYFNLPPKSFRSIFFRETFHNELVPRICKVASKNIITLNERFQGEVGWQKLYMYGIVNRLLCETTESIEIIVDGDFIPALTTKDFLPRDKYIESYKIPDGLYAIFTHKGDTDAVSELYKAIQNYWLPESKYRAGLTLSYAVYLNSRMTTPTEELLTEIYIPLSEKGA